MNNLNHSYWEDIQDLNLKLADTFSDEYLSALRQSIFQLSETINFANQQLALAAQQLVLVSKVVSQELNDILASVSSLYQSSEFDSIFNGIYVHDNSVEITEQAVASLNSFVEYPQEKHQAVKKLSFENFLIGILVPLILAIVPLIQNSYYRHLDDLESQKQQLIESEYRKKLIKLESDHNETLRSINETLKNIEQYLLECSDYHSPSEIRSDHNPEAAESAPGFGDDSDKSNTPQ